MELNYAFLCDYASHGPGKITAVGVGIDTLYAQQVPHIHDLLYAVIGIRFSMVEQGPKQLGVRIIDADGTSIAPALDTLVNVDPPAPGWMHRNITLALALHGLNVPRYGDYSVSFLVGGAQMAQLPLKVAPPPGLSPTA